MYGFHSVVGHLAQLATALSLVHGGCEFPHVPSIPDALNVLSFSAVWRWMKLNPWFLSVGNAIVSSGNASIAALQWMHQGMWWYTTIFTCNNKAAHLFLWQSRCHARDSWQTAAISDRCILAANTRKQSLPGPCRVRVAPGPAKFRPFRAHNVPSWIYSDFSTRILINRFNGL